MTIFTYSSSAFKLSALLFLGATMIIHSADDLNEPTRNFRNAINNNLPQVALQLIEQHENLIDITALNNLDKNFIHQVIKVDQPDMRLTAFCQEKHENCIEKNPSILNYLPKPNALALTKLSELLPCISANIIRPKVHALMKFTIEYLGQKKESEREEHLQTAAKIFNKLKTYKNCDLLTPFNYVLNYENPVKGNPSINYNYYKTLNAHGQQQVRALNSYIYTDPIYQYNSQTNSYCRVASFLTHDRSKITFTGPRSPFLSYPAHIDRLFAKKTASGNRNNLVFAVENAFSKTKQAYEEEKRKWRTLTIQINDNDKSNARFPVFKNLLDNMNVESHELRMIREIAKTKECRAYIQNRHNKNLAAMMNITGKKRLFNQISNT